MFNTVLQGLERPEFYIIDSIFHVIYSPRQLLPCLLDQMSSGPVLNIHLFPQVNCK